MKPFLLSFIILLGGAPLLAQETLLTGSRSPGGFPPSLAISQDGKTLASGNKDGTIKLWDVETGKNTATLKGHIDNVSSVAFSPDGKTLASGSVDKTIKLWELATGKNTATLNGHNGEVDSIAFSPSGKTLASGSKDRTIKLWDLESCKNTATLEGQIGGIGFLVFSPDGQTLASAAQGNNIELWAVDTGKSTLLSKEGRQCFCPLLVFSPDGKKLASGGICHTNIKLWDVAAGKKYMKLECRGLYEDGVRSLAFTPDGKTLASAGNRMVRIWDVATGNNIISFTKKVFAVGHPTSNWYGKLKLTAWLTFDKTLQLWTFDMSDDADSVQKE